MKLQDKIVFYRKRAGLSQEALAGRLHVSRQAVSKWETGEAVPELNKIVALAREFGVTTDELLLEECDPHAPESVYDEEKEPQEEPREATTSNWVESVPGVLGRLIRRYGWLLGVRIAVSGALFTAMGALARGMARSMTDNFGGFGSQLGGMDFGPDTLLEINGVFVNKGSGFASSDPVSIMGSFIMGLGIVMMIGGAALALVLYKNKQK